MIRNRSKQSIWLSQKVYIERICNALALSLSDSDRLPLTPMDVVELKPSPEEDDKDVSDSSRILYQQKVGSPLYAAIATRPDFAFAVSRFLRFNQQPGKKHHEAADRVFQCLYRTQDHCIRYGGEARDLSSFICVSDASFGDNSLDRKSSQGYIMKFFGVAVA